MHEEYADPAPAPAITANANAFNRAGADATSIAAAGAAHAVAHRGALGWYQGAHGFRQLHRVHGLLQNYVCQLLSLTRLGARDDDDGE